MREMLRLYLLGLEVLIKYPNQISDFNVGVNCVCGEDNTELYLFFSAKKIYVKRIAKHLNEYDPNPEIGRVILTHGQNGWVDIYYFEYISIPDNMYNVDKI